MQKTQKLHIFREVEFGFPSLLLSSAVRRPVSLGVKACHICGTCVPESKIPASPVVS